VNAPWLSQVFTRRWLIYLIVTILFAIACVGLGWAIRNEWRIRNADAPSEIARNAGVKEKKARRRPSDADVEDELTAVE